MIRDSLRTHDRTDLPTTALTDCLLNTALHSPPRPQITTFNSQMEAILREGEEFLEDIELAEGNVQQAYNEYRDQVCLPTCVGGMRCVC